MVRAASRPWTPREDQLLIQLVEQAAEQQGTHEGIAWNEIAKHLPNRTNKGCRRRWNSNLSLEVKRGRWSEVEDQRLLRAIDLYGFNWVAVAKVVQTRGPDQCGKRWTDSLDPKINHQGWSKEEDEELVRAVQIWGYQWSFVAQNACNNRSGQAARNRWFRLQRASQRKSKVGGGAEAGDEACLHDRTPSFSSSSSVCEEDVPVAPSPSLNDTKELHSIVNLYCSSDFEDYDAILDCLQGAQTWLRGVSQPTLLQAF
ncbi:hypothetical protein IE53DRAFT_104261 [Violaceomyces palustris]|uniref:Uncharacterized protein n=1 Tax=Violaceomyces palustris TaxID=1673888 RepID=A0ACD0P6W3_9BASI|nr:hypothetical protein IE53DRAFT_104261 [Violaceomyces palustris]